MDIRTTGQYRVSMESLVAPSSKTTINQPSNSLSTKLADAAIQQAAMEVIEQVVPNTDTREVKEPSAEYEEKQANLELVNSRLKTLFDNFKTTLKDTNPDLASKDFGFSVDAKGELVVLDPTGNLSAKDTEQLTALLNSDEALKDVSKQFVEAAIDFVKIDAKEVNSLNRQYFLTQENFASTINLATLNLDENAKGSKEGKFSQQLLSKGEWAPLIREKV